jgi:hypothetical protein
VCIISGLREELLDSSILVAAMSSLFESVSGLHGELVLRNSTARTATHRRFGSARAVLHCCRGPPRALFASWDVSIVQPRCFSSTHRARSELRPLAVAGSPLARRLLGTRLVWKQNQKPSAVSSHQPHRALRRCRRHIQIIPPQLHRNCRALIQTLYPASRMLCSWPLPPPRDRTDRVPSGHGGPRFMPPLYPSTR